jgi:hypothetical protein
MNCMERRPGKSTLVNNFSTDTYHPKGKNMKNEKPKLKEKEKTDSTDQQAIDTSAALKKRKNQEC